MAARHGSAGRVMVAGMGGMAGAANGATHRSAANGCAWRRAAWRRPRQLRARKIEAMQDGTVDLFIENRTFDEMIVGDTASLSHTVTQRDIDLFAVATGDVNPAHVDPAYAETDMFHHIIIHGMWGAGLISAVLGTKLPGPGTIYLC